ncbi:MAG: IMPACT family protein [Xanthomonadales bacterium]|nr:IMPACT family protein [Xanthomonadales bacterium]
MSEPLYALTSRCDYETTIRKSRFQAVAVSASDVEQAQAFLSELAQIPASHHCWAWRIGQNYRFSDDGEPGGSAGKPILQAIDGQSMDEVVVVVMRWFGGIKLGVGGLIRAYGGSAAECLRRSERLPIIVSTRVALECDFATWPLLKARLQTWAIHIEREEYLASGVALTLRVPDTQLLELQQLLADLSQGRNQLRVLD